MTSQHRRSISEYWRADIDRHIRPDYYVGRWCLLRNWYIATSKVGAHSTPRSQYERTGVVDLHNWIEYGPTISRHYDHIMIVIQWGKQWLSSSLKRSPITCNIVTFEIVDHTWPLCNYDHETINPDFLSITESNVFEIVERIIGEVSRVRL